VIRGSAGRRPAHSIFARSRPSYGRQPHAPLASVATRLHETLRRSPMLTLVILCLELWFFGFMTTYTLGGLLHILLVIAFVLLLVHIIQGRSIGDA
jgi:uncharacterized membrane protein